MIAHPSLPLGLIERCLDVLKEILPDERELIRIVVETVIDLRDTDEEQQDLGEGQSFLVRCSYELCVAPSKTIQNVDVTQSDISVRKERSLKRARVSTEMSAEERHEADLVDLRCLMLCAAVLERVHGVSGIDSCVLAAIADFIRIAIRGQLYIGRHVAGSHYSGREEERAGAQRESFDLFRPLLLDCQGTQSRLHVSFR